MINDNEKAKKEALKKRLQLLANGTKIMSKPSKFDRAREFEKDGNFHLKLWYKNKITGYEGWGWITFNDFIRDYDDFEIISLPETDQSQDIIVNGKKLTTIDQVCHYIKDQLSDNG
jgi:hypothetical protein